MYTPEIVPQSVGSAELQEYLYRELARIGSSFERLENLFLNPLAVAVTKPETGQIIYANGTNFNPGNGEGFYGRVGSNWVKLGIGTGDDLTLDDLTVNGITFPGSEVIDDFQQDSWTPVLVPNAGAFGAITYSAIRGGVINKLAKGATFSFQMATDSVTLGTASGQLRITGLPYVNGAVSGFAVGYVTSFAVNNPWMGLLSGGDIFLYHKTAITANSAATTAADLTTGASANANRFVMQGYYRTT